MNDHGRGQGLHSGAGEAVRRLIAVPALIVSCMQAALAVASDPAAMREIARSAYVWGYPTVDLYNILHGQALDPHSPEFKAPLNHVGHVRDVASPDDQAVIAPNVDTPYSYAWLDLRAEPVVVTVPPFEADRYVSLQLLDLYTWIIGYVTPRTNGHVGGDFLIAASGWSGDVPTGIREVFYSPTTLALAFFRTQLMNASDLPAVHALQDGYRVQTLSAYRGRVSPVPAPIPPLVAPVNLRRHPISSGYFRVLGWMQQFMPVLREEVDLRRSFEAIGIVPGRVFSTSDADDAEAMLSGMRDGLEEMNKRARRVRSSAELFGTREFLGNDYTTRAVGAMLGILGNAAEEFLGVGYVADANGGAFDGRKRYILRLEAGQLPPVDAFWSITAYTPQRLLYANPLKRYVINSPMLAILERDPDGSIALYIQHESPGHEHESNWLPVPATAFGLTFRTYLPRDAIRNGDWRAPPVVPEP